MEEKHEYVPSPIDTTGVELPESLAPLLELLAENVHETWAKGRVDAGWTYGPEHNVEKKTHPCLVSYSELPESEKDYDRETAFSTLKLACKKGFNLDLIMNQTIPALRRLLYGQCVVALDTNILIALGKEREPEWFKHFIRMREAGVKFSIPDLCVGERLNWFENADAKYYDDMKLRWYRMASRLGCIIWRELPCLPLRGDLYDLVGVKERGKEYVRERPFTVERARELYLLLCDYADSLYNRIGQRDTCIEEFKKVRRDWKKWILEWRTRSKGKLVEEMCNDHISDLEVDFVSPGGIAELFELPVRFAAECVADQRYNPTDDDDRICQGIKPSNDGLDYAILFLTMASINICSCDRLFKRAGRMKLNRASCCHRPETIFHEWQKGELPHVTVPMPMLAHR